MDPRANSLVFNHICTRLAFAARHDKSVLIIYSPYRSAQHIKGHAQSCNIEHNLSHSVPLTIFCSVKYILRCPWIVQWRLSRSSTLDATAKSLCTRIACAARLSGLFNAFVDGSFCAVSY